MANFSKTKSKFKSKYVYLLTLQDIAEKVVLKKRVLMKVEVIEDQGDSLRKHGQWK